MVEMVTVCRTPVTRTWATGCSRSVSKCRTWTCHARRSDHSAEADHRLFNSVLFNQYSAPVGWATILFKELNYHENKLIEAQIHLHSTGLLYKYQLFVQLTTRENAARIIWFEFCCFASGSIIWYYLNELGELGTRELKQMDRPVQSFYESKI